MAPLLTAMVSEFAKAVDRDMAGESWALAHRELRALLAVAKAARAEVRSWEQLYGDGNLNADHPLVRALARLARASRTEGGRP
jgi:hypothetical protein